MKMHRVLAAPYLFCALGLPAQATAQSFGWATSIPRFIDDFVADTAIDSEDSLYVTGSFRGVLDFDPGPGIFELDSGTSVADGYLWKLLPSGQLVRAVQFPAAPFDQVCPISVAIDSADNVYVAGQFEGTADFDPGPSVFSLTTSSSTGAFVVKLDRAGSFLWAVQADSLPGDPDDEILVTAMDVDSSGSFVCIAGTLSGSGDFDPGPGVSVLGNPGSSDDTFAWKLDSSGNFVWARSLTSSRFIMTTGLRVDSSSNLCLGGTFRGTVDMDPGPGTFTIAETGLTDIFACQLDGQGDLVWVRTASGFAASEGRTLTLDSGDNVVLGGLIKGDVDFAGAAQLFAGTAGDGFIWKLDSSGNHVWARRAGGIGFDRIDALEAGTNDEIYAAGRVSAAADFGPFDVSFAGGTFDALSCKLDAEGNFIWIQSLGADTLETFSYLSSDSANNRILAGNFKGSVDFDPGPGVFLLHEIGPFFSEGNTFLLKLGSSVETVRSSCFGNESGVPCPCGNNAQNFDGGCLNDRGAGAVLRTQGENAVSSDSLAFSLQGGSPLSFALLLSADNLLGGGLGLVGQPITDGLRCVGGNSLRHGTIALDDEGDSLEAWGTGLGILSQSGFLAGQTRHFQARYRADALTSPCGTDQNTSQALSVTFVP